MEVKFIETTSSKLHTLEIVDGQIIALSDTSGLYYDLNGFRRQAVYTLPLGTESVVGGVRLSDSYTASAGTASAGVAASSYALVSAYNALTAQSSNINAQVATNAQNIAANTTAISTINSDLTARNIDELRSCIGGKNGGIVFDSVAGAFSQSTSVTFDLSYTPLNVRSVVVTMVTIPSNNAILQNVSIDVENKQITIILSALSGNVRFCVCYPTTDDLAIDSD